MVERLKLYIEKRGLLPSQFADALGMPRSSFSQLMNGRNKSISDATIGKIHTAFPELSIQWLLFGEGEMETTTTTQKLAQQPLQQQPSSPITDHFQQQAQLSFFDENAIFPTDVQEESKYEQEIEVEQPAIPVVDTPQRYKIPVEQPVQKQRKITKIMVFYDDNTFESFKPE